MATLEQEFQTAMIEEVYRAALSKCGYNGKLFIARHFDFPRLKRLCCQPNARP
jgi:hypothetical protein